jgi:hypothetical protein
MVLANPMHDRLHEELCYVPGEVPHEQGTDTNTISCVCVVCLPGGGAACAEWRTHPSCTFTCG